MNKKSVIEKIKALFSEEVEQTFIDVKTQDGRILRASDIVIDGTILEVTEEGEVPLEDGEYILEEGYTLVVEAGVIKEIKEPVVEEPVAEEPVAEEQMEEEVPVKATVRKRFSGIVRYLIEDNTEAEAEGVQTEAEVTVVANEIKPEEPVVIIDENLQVVEDYTGTMDVMVEDQTHTVTIENGIITEVSGTEEVIEGEPEQVLERVEEPILEDFNSELILVLETIKGELEILKEENRKLSERFNKFAAEPSEEPIVTKIDFNKVDKNERLKFFGKK